MGRRHHDSPAAAGTTAAAASHGHEATPHPARHELHRLVSAGAAGEELARLIVAHPEQADALLADLHDLVGNHLVTQVMDVLPTLSAPRGPQHAAVPALHRQVGNSCGTNSLIAHLVVEDTDKSPGDHAILRAAIARATHRAHSRLVRQQLVYATDEHTAATQLAGADELLAGALIFLDAGDVPSAARDLASALFLMHGDGDMDDDQTTRASMSLGNVTEPTIYQELLEPAPAPTPHPASWEEIFDNPIVNTLQPGEAAQIAWSSTVTGHYFTIGLRTTGTYYLIDLGDRIQLEASDLTGLRHQIEAAIKDDRRSHLAGPGDPSRASQTPSVRRLPPYAVPHPASTSPHAT